MSKFEEGRETVLSLQVRLTDRVDLEGDQVVEVTAGDYPIGCYDLSTSIFLLAEEAFGELFADAINAHFGGVRMRQVKEVQALV